MPPSGSSTGFTPGERDYIRRELEMFFSTYPTVAEGFQLKTWRGGAHAGEAKLPPAAKSLLERGLSQARAQAGVPDEVVFKTKPQIALDQLRAAKAAGITAPIVLADAGYGNDTAFREGIIKLGFGYVVGIQSTTSLWPPGKKPLPKKQWSGRGRPTSAIRRDAENQPISAKALALALPQGAWRRVTWR
jgi:SRSO17 transposase